MSTTPMPMPMPPEHHSQRSFRLTRHFSLAGLVSIVIASLLLGQIYQHFARQQLIKNEERHNTELTRNFSGVIWPEYGAFLANPTTASGAALRDDQRIRQLHRLVQQRLRDSSIVKISIFNRDGLVVYSTALDQIGSNKAGYPGFEQARLGRASSHVSLRDGLHADDGDGRLHGRELLSSYLPVAGATGRIEGVIELYSDLGPLLGDIQQNRRQVVLATVAVMLLLYSLLFFIIKRADRIIQEKSDAQRRNEQQIRHQANHDTLTGLPNRRYFRQLLDECMARATDDDHLIAVFFIDLDRFKLINDTLGHQMGDELLKTLARRITYTLRGRDIVSRIGGDEFTVILDRLDNVQHMERAAQRILDSLAEPVYLRDKELTIGASIGIAIYPFDDQELDELIKHADTAMYSAKEDGRNCYRFYSQEMNAEVMRNMELERDLRTALRNRELEVHYQPRFDQKHDCITGVEALARWHHPEQGLIPPSEFIPIAEESGLIHGIGHWVMKTACEQIVALQQHGLPPLNLSVNVSARQFEDKGFVDEVRKLLQLTGLPPQRLELELTESILIRGCEACSTTLDAFKQLGVKLSLDDFGTGYSSLNYLKRLPLDILKIDRSFICDVTSNSRDAALVMSIASLAENLQMAVVAEGVETEDQMAFVQSCECHEVQGYLIARPLPIDALKDFLQDKPHKQMAG